MKMMARMKYLMNEGIGALPGWDNVTGTGNICVVFPRPPESPLITEEQFPEATQDEADECWVMMMVHLRSLEGKEPPA